MLEIACRIWAHVSKTYSQESEGHRSDELEDRGGFTNPHLDQKRNAAARILYLLAGDGDG